jgi:hypothetical protein
LELAIEMFQELRDPGAADAATPPESSSSQTQAADEPALTEDEVASPPLPPIIFTPTTSTLNTLLQPCSKSPTGKPHAMYLASVMVTRHIPPNSLTYDRLILSCLASPSDSADAFKYFDEMEALGWLPKLRQGTFTALVKRAAAEGKDGRVEELLRRMEECGMQTRTLRGAVALE